MLAEPLTKPVKNLVKSLRASPGAGMAARAEEDITRKAKMSRGTLFRINTTF